MVPAQVPPSVESRPRRAGTHQWAKALTQISVCNRCPCKGIFIAVYNQAEAQGTCQSYRAFGGNLLNSMGWLSSARTEAAASPPLGREKVQSSLGSHWPHFRRGQINIPGVLPRLSGSRDGWVLN